MTKKNGEIRKSGESISEAQALGKKRRCVRKEIGIPSGGKKNFTKKKAPRRWRMSRRGGKKNGKGKKQIVTHND